VPGAYLSGHDAYLSGPEAYLSGPDYPELLSREYSEAYEGDDIGDDVLYDEYEVCTHTSYSVIAFSSIRQHTSAYVSIRQHTSAYASIRQHTPAYASIRQHTSAYVSIRQHTPAYVSREYSEAYEGDDVGDDVLYDEYEVCTHALRTYAGVC
jgi:hypothetical protein